MVPDCPASAEEPGWNRRWAMSAGGPQGLTSFTNQHKNWDSTHLVPLLCSEYNYCYTTPHSSQSLCGSRGLCFCYCILKWLFNFSNSHLLKNTFNVTREQKNICNIFMLNHIVIQIGLQPQTNIPSCVFVWFFLPFFPRPPSFCVCVMRKPSYMAYFTDCCFCCFVVFFSSVKRLHDRIFHPWMSFWSHPYFRRICDFLCARIQHKHFMKLRKMFLVWPKPKMLSCIPSLVKSKSWHSTSNTCPCKLVEFIHAKSQNLAQSKTLTFMVKTKKYIKKIKQHSRNRKSEELTMLKQA